MKHQVDTSTHLRFLDLWESLLKRLDQTGEKIVRAKLKFKETYWTDSFRATVWTERAEQKEGGDHA